MAVAHPHTLQEVPVDSHATEWYLPVPLSDRDYRVELGYRVSGGGWISLAFSSVARVPALHPSEQILDQFVPFSLERPLRARSPRRHHPAATTACMSASIKRQPWVPAAWAAAPRPSTSWRSEPAVPG